MTATRRWRWLALLAILGPGRAHSALPWTSDNDAKGFYLRNTHVPAGDGSAVITAHFVTPGACPLASTGIDGAVICATATVASITVVDPISNTGTATAPILGLKFTNVSLKLTGAGALERAAFAGGDVVAGDDSNILTIAPNAVTFPKMQTVAGLSIVGVAGSSIANVAAITATGNTQVAQMLGGAVQFHTFDFSELTGAPTSLPPSGAAGGGLAGTYPNPTVTLAAGAVGYGGASSTLAGDATNFRWDPPNLRLGIREAAPAFQLHVVDEAAAADRGLAIGTYFTGNPGPLLTFQTSNGSFASPAAVTNTRYGGRVGWDFYDGTQYLHTAQVGTHVTNGATVTTGSIPTDLILGVNATGIPDYYAGSGTIVPLRISSASFNRGFVSINQNALSVFSNVSLAVAGNVLVAAAPKVNALGTTSLYGVTAIQQEGVVTPNILRFGIMRGTDASPANVQPGDNIEGIQALGWAGSWTPAGLQQVWVDYASTVSTGSVPTAWGVFTPSGSSFPGVGLFPAADVVVGSWIGRNPTDTGALLWIPRTNGAPSAAPVAPTYGVSASKTTTGVPITYDGTHDRLYGNNGTSWGILGQRLDGHGAGNVRTDNGGIESVDTTAYTPTSTTVAGTAPIAIAGDHAAHDLSANRNWSLDANGVTYAFLQQGAALSIPGRAPNSSGSWADIVAGAGSGGVLRESGSTLGFGSITEAVVTNLVADLAGKVPATRTISVTAPGTIDGGSSADLSANRTIAFPVFAGSTAGLVPASSGGTTAFLRADGTYAVPPGAGAGISAGTGPVTFSGSGSVATAINLAGGSITNKLALANEASPTGSGFAHVTSGAWDGAARAVDLSGGDVANLLPVTAIAPSGTVGWVLTTVSAGTVAWQAQAAPGIGTVTNVSSPSGDILVANGTSTPVLSLPNVGPGGSVGGSGIAGFTLNHAGMVSSVTTATYLTSTGTTPGTYNNITVASSGLITGASVTSWMTAGDLMKSGGPAALPVPAIACTDYEAPGCAQAGDLGGTFAAPTVLGLHDNTGTPWPIGVVAANGQLLGTQAGEIDGIPPSSLVVGALINVTDGFTTQVNATTTPAADNVLTISNSGSTDTIFARDSATVDIRRELNYYVEGWRPSTLIRYWLQPSSLTPDVISVEFSFQNNPTKSRLTAVISSNTLAGSNMTCFLSQSGSAVGSALVITAGVSGIYDTGEFSLPTTHTSDTWGVTCGTAGSFTGGAITGTFSTYVR